MRYPDISDLEEFTNLARKSEKFHRGLFRLARSRPEFDEYLKRAAEETTECFVICRNEDKAIVGTISLSQIYYGPFKNAYMGYGLGVEFIGAGYATEAVRLATRYAFTKLKLHRLEANIQSENQASINVARRAGFRKEGYSPRYLKIGGSWRDHERWAITREDWKKS